MSDPEKATLPKFHDILEAYPKELRSSIQFPLFNLRTLGLRGTVVKIVLSKKEKKKLKKHLFYFASFFDPTQMNPAQILRPRPTCPRTQGRRITRCWTGSADTWSRLLLCLLPW